VPNGGREKARVGGGEPPIFFLAFHASNRFRGGHEIDNPRDRSVKKEKVRRRKSLSSFTRRLGTSNLLKETIAGKGAMARFSSLYEGRVPED